MVSERRDPSCPKYGECLDEATHAKVPFSCKICKEKGFKPPVKKKEVSMRAMSEEKSVETDLSNNSAPNVAPKHKSKRRDVVGTKRPCIKCGGELPEKRSKFCSDKCMWKWHGENKKGKSKAKRTTLKPSLESIPRKRPLSKSHPRAQVASPEEVLRMLEKGVVLKVIALLKKEFDV